jgi:hypothetical protein
VGSLVSLNPSRLVGSSFTGPQPTIEGIAIKQKSSANAFEIRILNLPFACD